MPRKSPLSETIGKKLRRKGLTLAIAESCTGGYLSQVITTVPGSSDYFIGSVVAYGNSVKTGILNVKAGTLRKFGAVSALCAEEMVRGARKRFKTDHAIATTGIAGPGGAVPGKPVGMVYIAVASKKEVVVECFRFKGNREQVIRRASQKALQMLAANL